MRKLPVATLALVALLLTGCVPQTSVPTPEPSPSSTPVFASEEDALKAAEAAYAEYVKVADQIFMEGGADPERLNDVATGTFLAASLEGYRQTRDQGLRSQGSTEYRNVVLQSYQPEDGPKQIVSIYVCEDISGVDVLDNTGRSVVAATRPATTVFQVSFDYDEGKARLLVSSREAWSSDPC